MSKPSMPRTDYLVNSLTGFAVLAAVFFAALAFTLGYQGLLASPPGKARGLLVLVTTVSAILCALFQASIARRRAAETSLPKWFSWLFVSLLYLCALAYSAQLFYYDFHNPKNNEGSLLGLFFGLCACWGCLVSAAPVQRGHTYAREGKRPGPDNKIDASRVLNSRKKL